MQCLWEELLGGGDSPSKGSEVETVCSKEASEAETERVRWEVVGDEVTEMGWRGGGRCRPL